MAALLTGPRCRAVLLLESEENGVFTHEVYEAKSAEWDIREIPVWPPTATQGYKVELTLRGVEYSRNTGTLEEFREQLVPPPPPDPSPVELEERFARAVLRGLGSGV